MTDSLAITRHHALLPAEVVVLSAPVDDAALALVTPREAELVARAVDKRKREFATARVLARAAMITLGTAPVELLNAPDRSPVWPAELTGSISHCDTRALVAVGPRAIGTVGVDIEHRDELKRDLWKSVFLASEIRALDAAFDTPLRGRMALALFSAKEALYKAQHPWSKRYMGFHELEVVLEPTSADEGALRCTFQNDVPPFAERTVALGRYSLGAFPGIEVATAILIPPELPSLSAEPAPR